LSNTEDNLSLHVMDAIDQVLRQQIYPELQSSHARLHADMVSRLLKWLSNRQSNLSKQTATRNHAVMELARQAQVLARTTKPNSEKVTADPTDWTAIAALVTASGRLDPLGRSRQILFEFLAAESELVRKLDPDPPSSIAENYEAGKLHRIVAEVSADIVLNDETLTAYLLSRFPDYPGIRAKNTSVLSGGFGKDTILFEILDGGPNTGSVVMRKDLPISPIDVTVIGEFLLLQKLHAAGIRVPTPMWAEADPTALGTPFIVVRRVPGSIDVTSWVHDRQAVLRFSEELAATMAQIHALNSEHLGYAESAAMSAAQGTTQVVRQMRELYRRKADQPSWVLEVAFEWLLSNVPSCDDREARLVHGDIGFHNILMERGQVTAVLDWEFQHFGDPAEDVSYCRPFIERLLPWPTFLEMYARHGGAPYSTEQDAFFSVWRNVRNAAACAGSRYAFEHAPVGSVKLATGGLIYGPRFEIEALRNILGVLT
jgi:aminoglycoside phosphotransferase (APT) family kinase protein